MANPQPYQAHLAAALEDDCVEWLDLGCEDNVTHAQLTHVRTAAAAGEDSNRLLVEDRRRRCHGRVDAANARDHQVHHDSANGAAGSAHGPRERDFRAVVHAVPQVPGLLLHGAHHQHVASLNAIHPVVWFGVSVRFVRALLRPTL